MRKTGVYPFPKDLHFDNAGHNGKRRIVLTEDFPVITSRGIFVVPKGFISDGASIPKAAHSIVGHPFDEYLEDAVWHDYVYTKAPAVSVFTRKEADDFFRETMWNRNIALWKIATFYMALRIGGGKNWRVK